MSIPSLSPHALDERRTGGHGCLRAECDEEGGGQLLSVDTVESVSSYPIVASTLGPCERAAHTSVLRLN